MVARGVPQSARPRRHAESRKPDLRGRSAGGRWQAAMWVSYRPDQAWVALLLNNDSYD